MSLRGKIKRTTIGGVKYWHAYTPEGREMLSATRDELLMKCALEGMLKRVKPGMTGKELRYIRQRLNKPVATIAAEYSKSVRMWEDMEAGRRDVPDDLEIDIRLAAEEAQIAPYGTPEPVVTPRHLRAYRRTKGLNQAEFAILLRVTAATLSRWESGARKIPPWVLYVLRKLNKEENRE